MCAGIWRIFFLEKSIDGAFATGNRGSVRGFGYGKTGELMSFVLVGLEAAENLAFLSLLLFLPRAEVKPLVWRGIKN